MQTWDIFCTVIDNYGDIGITWRLARQLAAEHGVRPRLWVDDLRAFHAIRPEVDPAREHQVLAGVEIRRWTDPLPEVEPGRVVIEALACNLPETFIQAMAVSRPKPVWLNLEYLSAEDWVRGCHGLPSPDPRLPLTKYFFMPGYVPGTGGVLREAWLEASRRDFQASAAARTAFLLGLGVAEPAAGALLVSLFAYETRSVGALLETWAHGAEPVELYIPRGKVLAGMEQWLGRSIAPGDSQTRGNLRLWVLPMLDQDAYDRLLWACDCNFVRGEDSFVRAQWAARPLVWQAYRQEEDAQRPKIEAFLDLYCAGLEPQAAEALRTYWVAWNEDRDSASAWPAYRRRLAQLHLHAERWTEVLAAPGDLAGNLVRFCEKQLSEKSQ